MFPLIYLEARDDKTAVDYFELLIHNETSGIHLFEKCCATESILVKHSANEGKSQIYKIVASKSKNSDFETVYQLLFEDVPFVTF